jgi:hypothetical protein
MRLRTIDRHIHEVTFHTWKGALFMGAWCTFFICMLAMNVRESSQERHPILGPLVGIAVTGLTAIAFYEKGRFTFDTSEKIVTWSRRSLWWGKSGTIPFGDIRAITLAKEWMGNQDGGWRIEIRTKNGDIPLTRAYYGLGKKQMQSIVDQLAALLSGKDQS